MNIDYLLQVIELLLRSRAQGMGKEECGRVLGILEKITESLDKTT